MHEGLMFYKLTLIQYNPPEIFNQAVSEDFNKNFQFATINTYYKC